MAKELIENVAGNTEAIRSSTANLPEMECKRAIDLAMSEELLRDLMPQLLEQLLRPPLSDHVIRAPEDRS